MKNTFIVVSILGVVLIVGFGLLYYKFFSLSSILREDSFSKEDIVTSKDYLIDSNSQYKLLVLSNEEQLGLIVVKKNKYGLLKRMDLTSVKDRLSDSKFITTSIALPKGWGEDYDSQKVVFIASYVDEAIANDNILTEDFSINIEHFNIKDNKLLLVEAKAGKNHEGFGSDDVLHYLQEKVDIFK